VCCCVETVMQKFMLALLIWKMWYNNDMQTFWLVFSLIVVILYTPIVIQIYQIRKSLKSIVKKTEKLVD
jgi:hypothetical protein